MYPTRNEQITAALLGVSNFTLSKEDIFTYVEESYPHLMPSKIIWPNNVLETMYGKDVCFVRSGSNIRLQVQQSCTAHSWMTEIGVIEEGNLQIQHFRRKGTIHELIMWVIYSSDSREATVAQIMNDILLGSKDADKNYDKCADIIPTLLELHACYKNIPRTEQSSNVSEIVYGINMAQLQNCSHHKHLFPDL